MIYVWNGFAIIGRKPELLDSISQIVEDAINDLLARKGTWNLWPYLFFVCMFVNEGHYSAFKITRSSHWQYFYPLKSDWYSVELPCLCILILWSKLETKSFYTAQQKNWKLNTLVHCRMSAVVDCSQVWVINTAFYNYL